MDIIVNLAVPAVVIFGAALIAFLSEKVEWVGEFLDHLITRGF